MGVAIWLHSILAKQRLPGALGIGILTLCLGLSGCAKVVEEKLAQDVAKGAEESVATRLVPWFESLLARRQLSSGLKGGQQVVFKAFEAVRPKARWKIFAKTDVKNFVRLFEAGAREPERYLADAKIDPALLSKWNSAPVEKRVFVAGSKEDTPAVQDLRAKLEKDGNAVFFYSMCTGVAGQLCMSQTVGAFFGTAGTAVVVLSEKSADSPFVPQEIAAALNVKAHGSGILLLSPKDAMDAATRGATVQVAAAVTPPSDAKRN